MEGNRLNPIFAAIGLGLAVLVGVRACSRGSVPPDPYTLKDIPAAPAPDADSPADTVRALTAEVATMKTETGALRRENQSLNQQREAIAQQVTNQVKEDLRRESGDERDTGYAQLLSRVETLAKQLETQPDNTAPVPIDTGVQTLPAGSIVWIEPLGSSGTALLDKAGHVVATGAHKAGEAVSDAGSLLHDAGENIGSNPLLEHAGMGNVSNVPVNPPEPVYTVPRNATLIGSTGMTALLGRIPIKGQVEDPFPFKVIVGRDNLAANGLEIPGVDGMIFSGEAFGDWALSCVRGKVLSVTYVFEDGTVRSLSSDDQSLQQKSIQSAQAQEQQANQSNTHKPLGWISDRRGIPCVTGERITNAPEYLGGRFLARAIGAAGQAYARAQSTITTSPLTGGFTSGVTGNPAQYAAGETAAGGADELAAWITERQSQSFDVIFVDTGVELAVHVDQELPIDFEPKGRKLAYARANTTHRDLHDLD